MSTKPLDKRVPHIGEKAVKRSSTPQPTLEGHSLLPQTDESVRKRTLSRTQGRPRDLVLPPLEHSVLIHTEAAYMPGLNAESAVNQTLQSTSLGRSATTAHPHKQSIKVKPTRSNTLPTSQPEPSGSEGVDVGISATVYLKTLDGSRTVHNATDANSVLRYILERGWLSDQMQTIAVWEVWTQLGIERPLRPDESIKALMDSWDTTSKAVLMVKRIPTLSATIDQVSMLTGNFKGPSDKCNSQLQSIPLSKQGNGVSAISR